MCADRRPLVSCWSLRVLLPVTSSTAWLKAGCLAGGPGERDWMRPSVVRVSADPGDPADLGNDSLPDAVVEGARNDALRCDIFDGFDPPFATEKVPKHDHRYIHPAPARPRRARRLGHTYASRVAVRNRPPPPGRSASPDEARQRTFAPSAAVSREPAAGF